MPEKVMPCHLDVIVALWRKDNNFLEFSGFDAQIEGGQNTVSTVAPSFFDISSAMRSVG